MKLSLNVDFDSLEEYLEFFAVLQSHFGGQGIAPKPKVGITSKVSSLLTVQEPVANQSEACKAFNNKTSHKIRHIIAPTKPRISNSKQTSTLPQLVELQVPSVAGFLPSEEMLSKVKAYIEKGQAFKTQDVVSATVMGNPSRRTRANKWLKGHPKLDYERGKRENGKRGLGSLIYTPLPIGKEKGAALKSQTTKNKKQQTKPTQKLSLLGFRPTTEMQRKVMNGFLNGGQVKPMKGKGMGNSDSSRLSKAPRKGTQ
jgi:hypothetical protein